MNQFEKILPDDIIDLIYSKIYYCQSKDLLLDIKATYYIKNDLLNKYVLVDLLGCLLVHIDRELKNINNIDTLFNNIEKIHNKISSLIFSEMYNLFIKTINTLNTSEKFKFIYYIEDHTIHGYVDDNIIYNTVNFILNKKMI